MERRVSTIRVCVVVVGVLLFVGAILAGPTPEGRGEFPLRIIATVGSIFAGMMLAIMTLLGDPKNLLAGNWRVASFHRRHTGTSLDIMVGLFWIYLLAIALTLMAAVFDTYMDDLCIVKPEWIAWAKHIAICIGGLGMVLSFWLPPRIRRIQMDRMKEEVENRRNPP